MIQTMIESPYYQISNRVLAATLGCYAFCWGFTAFGIAALAALGVDFHEAETAMLMLVFLVFTGLFLWTFAASSLLRIWLVLAGGAASMSAIAWAIQRALI